MYYSPFISFESYFQWKIDTWFTTFCKVLFIVYAQKCANVLLCFIALGIVIFKNKSNIVV